MARRPLAGLLRLAIYGAVLYFGVTELWPWLQAKVVGTGSNTAAVATSAGNSEGSVCVEAAQGVSRDLAIEARAFRTPPHDLAAWGQSTARINDAISSAERRCTCPEESCRTARRGLDELRRLHTIFDGMIRGDTSSFGNPAVQRERVDDLLDRARALARQGS
ncbi:MAG: hypothetical protein AAF604_20265 [Acidobacteriota bacterium]